MRQWWLWDGLQNHDRGHADDAAQLRLDGRLQSRGAVLLHRLWVSDEVYEALRHSHRALPAAA